MNNAQLDPFNWTTNLLIVYQKDNEVDKTSYNKTGYCLVILFYSQFAYSLSSFCTDIRSIRLSKFSLNKSCYIFLSSFVACIPACV